MNPQPGSRRRDVEHTNSSWTSISISLNTKPLSSIGSWTWTSFKHGQNKLEAFAKYSQTILINPPDQIFSFIDNIGMGIFKLFNPSPDMIDSMGSRTPWRCREPPSIISLMVHLVQSLNLLLQRHRFVTRRPAGDYICRNVTDNRVWQHLCFTVMAGRWPQPLMEPPTSFSIFLRVWETPILRVMGAGPSPHGMPRQILYYFPCVSDHHSTSHYS